MKTLFPTVTFLLTLPCAVAQPAKEEVTVKLGPKHFLDGDTIKIESVMATSPKLEPGDTVTGKYRLDSHEKAQLALHLTQIEGDGREETDASQIVTATKGWNDFEVEITIKHRGYLHLSFYDTGTGKGFGGVYFATPEEIDAGIPVMMAHYSVER